MRRREFITLLGGAAAWPVAARAQQPERMRRIGVLMSTSGDDPESQARLMAFTQGLQQLGWSDGRYVRIETRWALGETARVHRYAAELIELSPDVIVTGGRVASVVPAIEQAGRRIPIVFVQAVDPVGSGYIASLASPRRQRHRIHPIRVHIERKMVGIAQGGCASHDPRRGPSGIRPSGSWAMGRHSNRGVIAGGGADPD